MRSVLTKLSCLWKDPCSSPNLINGNWMKNEPCSPSVRVHPNPLVIRIRPVDGVQWTHVPPTSCECHFLLGYLPTLSSFPVFTSRLCQINALFFLDREVSGLSDLWSPPRVGLPKLCPCHESPCSLPARICSI